MSNERYIPTEEETTSSVGGKSWRFAKGKIVTGPKDQITERPFIAGYILRVGIHEGVTDDQYAKPYKQVEADIETRDGILYVKGGLLDGETFELRPSRSSLDFAWGLLQFGAEDLVKIVAAQGEPWKDDMGREREASTYVNWEKLEPVEKDGKTIYVGKRIYRPKVDKNAVKVPMTDQWNELEPQIRAHPLFGPRSASHTDDEDGNATTHLSALCKECQEKGWPTPEQAPAEWLEMATPTGQPLLASLAQVSEDQWGALRLALKDRGPDAMPKKLIPAKERLAGTVAVGSLD